MRVHFGILIFSFVVGCVQLRQAFATDAPEFQTNVEIQGRADQVKASFEVNDDQKADEHAWLKLEDTFPDSTKSAGAVRTETVKIPVTGLTYDRANQAIDYKDKSGKTYTCATHVSHSVFGGVTYDKQDACLIEVDKQRDNSISKFSLHSKWKAHVSLKVI